MSFVIYNKTSFKRVSLGGQESFATERTAKGILTKAINASAEKVDRHARDNRAGNGPRIMVREDYVVATYEAWAAAEPMVETYNMLDPERRVVMIRASDKGGCCDPATETYHSM